MPESSSSTLEAVESVEPRSSTLEPVESTETAEATAAAETVAEPLVEQDLLVEDGSIDGMCGVY